MKKEIFTVLLALCLLAGCGTGGEREPVECVSTADCVLCKGAGTWAWGQNNVWLISLNTFDMVPIEINRYDSGGGLIEENTGTFQIRHIQGGEEGFSASVIEEPDFGYATLTVTLGEDGAMDRGKAAAFLCENCLEDIVPEGEETLGLGVIDFATGKVEAFDRKIRGFGAGDFRIHCDWPEEGEKVELLIFYAPLRYENEA